MVDCQTLCPPSCCNTTSQRHFNHVCCIKHDGLTLETCAIIMPQHPTPAWTAGGNFPWKHAAAWQASCQFQSSSYPAASHYFVAGLWEPLLKTHWPNQESLCWDRVSDSSSVWHNKIHDSHTLQFHYRPSCMTSLASRYVIGTAPTLVSQHLTGTARSWSCV